MEDGDKISMCLDTGKGELKFAINGSDQVVAFDDISRNKYRLIVEMQIGKGSIVGAGAVILENTQVPPFSLVVGSPAQVKKQYPEEILNKTKRSAQVYIDRAEEYLKNKL